MTAWSVTIESEGEDGVFQPGTSVSPSALDELLCVLAEYSPVVIAPAESGAGPGRYGVDVSVNADTALEATYMAHQLVWDATRKVGLPEWPIVKLEAQTEDSLDASLATPNFPNLLGVTELAHLLGVSRQRASELAHSPSFPRPVSELASGPVWIEPTVLRYVEEWERRPGRRRADG